MAKVLNGLYLSTETDTAIILFTFSSDGRDDDMLKNVILITMEQDFSKHFCSHDTAKFNPETIVYSLIDET